MNYQKFTDVNPEFMKDFLNIKINHVKWVMTQFPPAQQLFRLTSEQIQCLVWKTLPPFLKKSGPLSEVKLNESLRNIDRT